MPVAHLIRFTNFVAQSVQLQFGAIKRTAKCHIPEWGLQGDSSVFVWPTFQESASSRLDLVLEEICFP